MMERKKEMRREKGVVCRERRMSTKGECRKRGKGGDGD